MRRSPLSVLSAIRKRVWLVFVLGVLLGALVLLVIRYFTYNPPQVHYHANFAVYLNGQRFEFRGPQYYQEVAVCSSTNDVSLPQQRAHMHDNVNSVVHVHDHAVTWGQFFENLGWYIGPNFIETDNGTMYAENGSNKLHVLINGQDYTGLTPITNMVIKDRSRLLVSFGDVSDVQLRQEYATVPATAAHVDSVQDPSSCAGTEKVTPKDRLHHLF